MRQWGGALPLLSKIVVFNIREGINREKYYVIPLFQQNMGAMQWFREPHSGSMSHKVVVGAIPTDFPVSVATLSSSRNIEEF